jgi:tyrosinase
MALQVATRPSAQRAALKVRESITQLSDESLRRFGEAVQRLLERPDNRGFQYFAGWHGVPLGICRHHDVYFLPWHRGYLYFFELALQDIDADVTLPWWNWMDEQGIPASFEQPPLDGAPIDPMGVPHQPGWPTQTSRDPGAPVPPGFPAPWPPPLRRTVIGGQEVDLYAWIMDSPDYLQFMQRCWRVHDNIHVWVGGTMGDPNWAAFDPLFWAHHTMVDRLWRIWQHNHPGGDPPPAILDEPLTFATSPSMTVRELLDVTQLGYEYAGQTATVGGPQ